MLKLAVDRWIGQTEIWVSEVQRAIAAGLQIIRRVKAQTLIAIHQRGAHASGCIGTGNPASRVFGRQQVASGIKRQAVRLVAGGAKYAEATRRV